MMSVTFDAQYREKWDTALSKLETHIDGIQKSLQQVDKDLCQVEALNAKQNEWEFTLSQWMQTNQAIKSSKTAAKIVEQNIIVAEDLIKKYNSRIKLMTKGFQELRNCRGLKIPNGKAEGKWDTKDYEENEKLHQALDKAAEIGNILLKKNEESLSEYEQAITELPKYLENLKKKRQEVEKKFSSAKFVSKDGDGEALLQNWKNTCEKVQSFIQDSENRLSQAANSLKKIKSTVSEKAGLLRKHQWKHNGEAKKVPQFERNSQLKNLFNHKPDPKVWRSALNEWKTTACTLSGIVETESKANTTTAFVNGVLNCYENTLKKMPEAFKETERLRAYLTTPSISHAQEHTVTSRIEETTEILKELAKKINAEAETYKIQIATWPKKIQDLKDVRDKMNKDLALIEFVAKNGYLPRQTLVYSDIGKIKNNFDPVDREEEQQIITKIEKRERDLDRRKNRILPSPREEKSLPLPDAIK